MGEFGSTSELLRGRYGKTSDAPPSSPVACTDAAGGSTLAAENADRTYIIIQNSGTHPVLINLGGTPSTVAYHYSLSACTATRDGLGGSVKIENYYGIIKGIAIGGAVEVAVLEVLY